MAKEHWTIRIDPLLKEKLTTEACERGVTVDNLLQELLAQVYRGPPPVVRPCERCGERALRIRDLERAVANLTLDLRQARRLVTPDGDGHMSDNGDWVPD